jgi:hypothetical protein
MSDKQLLTETLESVIKLTVQEVIAEMQEQDILHQLTRATTPTLRRMIWGKAQETSYIRARKALDQVLSKLIERQ